MELRKYKEDIVARLYRDTFFVLSLSMLAAAVGTIIDGVIIGKNLGADSMAALGFTHPYQKFAEALPSVLMLGMQILCSQKLGKGKLNEANGIFSLALSFTIFLSILFIAAAFLFPAQIADILGATENLGIVRTETINYFQAYSLGLPALATVVILTPIMQLDSDRQRAVKAVTILSVTDILGDLIAIFYFDGGMWEIGIATTVSYCASAAFLILHFFKPEANIKFSAAYIKISNLCEMILTGSPVMIGRVAVMLQIGCLNYITLDAGGAASVAAWTIWNNFYAIVVTFQKSIAGAAQMLAGIFIGEKDKNAILRMIKTAFRYSLLFSLIAGIILILGAREIASIYIADTSEVVFDMVVEGLYFMAFIVIFITLTELLQYFYQACGRFKLVNFMAVINNILFIVPLALILTPHFGMTGFWAGYVLSKVLFLLTIIFVVWYYHKKITFKLEDILLLPKDCDSAENPQINITVTSKAEVLELAEQVQYFCRSHNISKRKGVFAAISVEEMATNIIEHGFNDGKKHSIDIRIIISGENVIVRIRDDCRAFNPKKWQEIYNNEDPAAHIGIKLVSQMATEFNYINVLKLNNLIIKI